MGCTQYRQGPIAIVGFAGRLPGGNRSPRKLWDFLERGAIADNTVPATRFNFAGHYDGSHKPGTMRPKGGMFLGDVDLADFDAAFFEISGTEAVAMDPNQRQMLEVVYEALENAGMPLETLDGAPVACYVGSYASDYNDMQSRDAEDRPANCSVGVGRAILANRLSYFLNIKGPSITIDTACSGSLVGLDLACRSLQLGEVDAAIVAASNLYLNPDHVMDTGSVGQAFSPSALCHTFDIDADGYVKAESVNCVIVKRVEDALRDRDPIRAIVLGTASNSNGRTQGIANPSATDQARAVRQAYTNAGITDFNETAYIECHGTGTNAGDPQEVAGIGSVFGPMREPERPLIIGSIKSNMGHAEPAAAINGLMKVVMSMETGIIPGNPTFLKPNPKIDFISNKVVVSRTAVPWPDDGYSVRRAGVNSFGYGGSNAHAIIEGADATCRQNHVFSYQSVNDDDDLALDEDQWARPCTLVVSANDADTLKANIEALTSHLINPRVHVCLPDLAYTLSERRSHLWHRAFATTTSTTEIRAGDFTLAKKVAQQPNIGIVFTGQGAQWPLMGKDLLEFFPDTLPILEELDQVLQARPDRPNWSIVKELIEPRPAEHMRKPDLSQTLTTALQLCIYAVLQSWGVNANSVVGHSSGEIAAAYAAGYLDRGDAITAAFCRGRAAQTRREEVESEVGMIAVGLSEESIQPLLEKYAGHAWIACYNSPSSLTISGRKPALDALIEDIKAMGYFARTLQVDLAYHSELMGPIGEEYESLLNCDQGWRPLRGSPSTTMFSSVTASRNDTIPDSSYWKRNMMSPVRFGEALRELVVESSPKILIEVGPSGALSGPVTQVLKSLSAAHDVSYCTAWSRGANAGKSLFDVAGRLYASGAHVDLSAVNGYKAHTPRVIVDLPNYRWNHSIKYWHESAASRDWRFRKFVHHDLLGSKVPGTTWEAPTWRKNLKVDDVPWLRDHRMGPDILIPGGGFVTIALEAMYQMHCATKPEEAVDSANELAYHFRNVRFQRAVVVEEGKAITIMLTLSRVAGNQDWYEFRVRTTVADVVYEHCRGLVCVQTPLGEESTLTGASLEPLKNPQSAGPWYKSQREVGMRFGPTFQLIKSIESVSGSRVCRSIVGLEPPESKWDPQSYYPLHPAVLDNCLQTATFANAEGERTRIDSVMIPAQVDDLVINKVPRVLKEGLGVAESIYTGRGRKELPKNWRSNLAVHDPETGELIMRCTGLSYIRLDVEQQPDPHIFQTVTWQPDISLLTPDQLKYFLASDKGYAAIDKVVDLIAYKTPTLKVLEMNLDQSDVSTWWFSRGDESVRAAYTQYDFFTPNPQSLVTIEAQFETRKNTACHLLASDTDRMELPEEAGIYDLAIIKLPVGGTMDVEEFSRRLKSRLTTGAFALLVAPSPGVLTPEVGSIAHLTIEESFSEVSDASHDTPSLAESLETGLACSDPAPPQCRSKADTGGTALHPLWNDESTRQQFSRVDTVFSSVIAVPVLLGRGLTHIYCNDLDDPKPAEERWHLRIARCGANSPVIAADVAAALRTAGWSLDTTCSVQELVAAGMQPEPRTIVLIMTELVNPVLTEITESDWQALQRIITSGAALLWLTKGAQTSRVTDPDNALVYGLFRTARRENPGAQLTLLDVQSATSAAMGRALIEVLQKLRSGTGAEAEYAERDGIVHIQRLLPDVPMNAFKSAEGGEGLPPAETGLHATEALVRLQAEKLGTLSHLNWSETAVGEVPVQAGWVEVEIMAAGVNFRDVATVMGIVPGDEYALGCEGVGYIKRVGAGVTRHQVGDRVCMNVIGTFANRVQCPELRAHALPSWMSYADAATIPLVFLTAIYGLYHLGDLREGQTVLIHSAAGGVGIAAIQLAQHKKCDIFVTVGSEDKRKYLRETFNIPADRIFSSRDVGFASGIRRATGGRGCDLVLNSLVGAMLDESWRLTADGGTMVEIGKRDIVDRNTLAMEPFERNCTYRGLDLSYTKNISEGLAGRLLGEIFELLEAGHIKPIRPITVYPFEKLQSALSYMRSGQHMGKIVICNEDQVDPQLPIRPAIRKLTLSADAAYLIVGGLKGLCGSIAVHLARHGARTIVVMSRSGTNDEASARAIDDCNQYECEVITAKGDVTEFDFVRRVFQDIRPRCIAGVIQGAMVLRDKPYEMMTHNDYYAAIQAKVTGTWNLHHAARQTQKRPLDFFTMLSSISGVIGNKGQANYAAANTFLDAFASYRHGLGLAAHTVDLGAIEDVGHVAEHGDTLRARFDQNQWTMINEGMLRRIIGYSVFQQDSGDPLNAESKAQLVTGLAYPLRADESDLADERRFHYLFNCNVGDNAAGSDAGRSEDPGDQAIQAFQRLRTSGAGAVALTDAVLSLLQAQVTRALRLEIELEPGKPLIAYGLDSLSAVELRGWIRLKLNAELSTLDITNAVSLVALCEKIVSRLLDTEGTQVSSNPGKPSEHLA